MSVASVRRAVRTWMYAPDLYVSMSFASVPTAVRTGMYAPGGVRAYEARGVRLGFGSLPNAPNACCDHVSGGVRAYLPVRTALRTDANDILT